MTKKPHGAGKSSIDLVNSSLVFEKLAIRAGMTFFDIACGQGLYALEASKRIGQGGRVYALDLWEEGIESLQEVISREKIENITPIHGDVGEKSFIPDHCADAGLIATALHDFPKEILRDAVAEIKRIIKPTGILGVVEFNKVEGRPGPPLEMKLSPEQVNDILSPFGFTLTEVVGVGPHNYLALFKA